MEKTKTSISILSINVFNHFADTFGLEYDKERADRISRFIETNGPLSPFIHISVYNKRDKKLHGCSGLNEYMPSYFVHVSYDGLRVKMEDREHKSFEIFEYEDIKHVTDEVNNFIKRHMK